MQSQTIAKHRRPRWSKARKLRFARTICLVFILASAPGAVWTYLLH